MAKQKQSQEKQVPKQENQVNPFFEENKEVLTRFREQSMFMHRAFAISEIGHINENERPSSDDVKRLLVMERDRFLRMLSPNQTTLWIYNSDTLRGLVYMLLMRYSDSKNELFPPSLDQFLYTDDSAIKDAYFRHDGDALPEQRLCVIMLGTTGRNAYLPEIVNEIIRHREAFVSKFRTVFLYKGTRETFRRDFGGVGDCTLDRDEYVIDWNTGAEALTNKAMNVSEDVRSRTTKSVVDIMRDNGGTTFNDKDKSFGTIMSKQDKKNVENKNRRFTGKKKKGKAEDMENGEDYTPNEHVFPSSIDPTGFF